MRAVVMAGLLAACHFRPVQGEAVDALEEEPDAQDIDGPPYQLIDGSADAAPVIDARPPDARFVFSSCARASAPSGYVQTAGGTTCYRFDTTELSWGLAEADCENDGVNTHLAVVTTKEEVDALTQLVEGQDVWLGLSDRADEGVFLWVTNVATSYTNWSVGEPNDAGTEDCTEMDASGAWNDHECATSSLNAYVCEVDDQEPDPVRYTP